MTRFNLAPKRKYLEATQFDIQPLKPQDHQPPKEEETTEKSVPKISKRNRKTCFLCRKRGHNVENCKNAKSVGICFHCGSTEHSLSECKRYKAAKANNSDKLLKYAICFVCQKAGHLSSDCPQNTKGKYINGGQCVKCGQKDHLAKECPNIIDKRRMEREIGEKILGKITLEQGGDEDDLYLFVKDQTNKKPKEEKPKKKVVNFK